MKHRKLPTLTSGRTFASLISPWYAFQEFHPRAGSCPTSFDGPVPVLDGGAADEVVLVEDAELGRH